MSSRSSLSPDDIAAITGAVVQARRTEASQPHVVATRKLKLAAAVGSACVGAITVIGGAAITYHELQGKPTTPDMRQAIDAAAEPLGNKVQMLEGEVSGLRGDVDRVESVQDLILEQSEWEGEVLEHIANKKRGTPPEMPKTIKDKRRDLIR